MRERYKIADVVFDAQFTYAYTRHICRNYVYQGDQQPLFELIVTKEDIAEEGNLDGQERFEPPYLESLSLYRKLLLKLIDLDGMVFHSSAVAVDGQAYLFTAVSGTGKSTHTALWRKLLGDRAVMINDDKPIIRYVDGEFFVYGTPWNGKHELDTNQRAKIKAVCKLERGQVNFIEEITSKEMLPVILNQTLRYQNVAQLDKLLTLTDKLLTTVKLYKLKCNTDISSAKLSYTVMSGGCLDEN